MNLFQLFIYFVLVFAFYYFAIKRQKKKTLYNIYSLKDDVMLSPIPLNYDDCRRYVHSYITDNPGYNFSDFSLIYYRNITMKGNKK